MSREAFKMIVKKTVDKVSSSVPGNHIPKTPAKIRQYVQSSQRKVTKLVMVCLHCYQHTGYVLNLLNTLSGHMFTVSSIYYAVVYGHLTWLFKYLNTIMENMLCHL